MKKSQKISKNRRKWKKRKNSLKIVENLFLENRKSVLHQIWHQIRIPRLIYPKTGHKMFISAKDMQIFSKKKIDVVQLGVVYFDQKRAVLLIYTPL